MGRSSKFGTASYIREKKRLLNEFCVPEKAVESLNWDDFKTESECERAIRALLAKVWAER